MKIMTTVCVKKLINILTDGEVKGQLISKCVLDVIIWTKIPTKKIPGFLP
jgi:hypothetical protein